MKILIVGGAIANKPFNGGAAWTRLNWALGFRKLGFDVYLVEQIDPDACVDQTGEPTPFEQSVNRAYFWDIAEQFGLARNAALLCGAPHHADGMEYRRLSEVAGAADLLVNISGHLRLDDLKHRVQRKAYVDLDPGFTQCWHKSGISSTLAGHDYYFTVGENIGTVGCLIPTNGIRWLPTRQPVVPEHWPLAGGGEPGRFTTVASWRGPFGPIECRGRTLGSKVRQFRKYVTLPPRLDVRMELALDIHPLDHRDREELVRNGWNLVDSRTVASDPAAFRRYVQGSGAEFSVAQEVYVETRSGWFSDRSVRYLASGRPVLLEDTGFSRNYRTGEGLLHFSSIDEAEAGVREITRNYASHAAAARKIAETCFDSSHVLGHFLDRVGVCP